MDAPVNQTSSQTSTDEAIDKVKMLASQAYDKTAQVTRETYRKIDEKYHDPQFQQDIQDFKEKVSVKGKEIGQTTIVYSNKAYFGIKAGMASAWDAIQIKYKQLKSDKSEEEAPVQSSLKEQLLNQDEKEVD